MANHPAVQKAMERIARQKRCVTVLGVSLLVAFLGIGLMIGLNNAIRGQPGATIGNFGVIGVVTILGGFATAFVALVAYLICGLLTRSAVKAIPDDAATSDPLLPGEQVGRMVVLEADQDVLHLALTSSPVVAGLARFVVSIVLLGLGVFLASNPLWAPNYSTRLIFVGALSLAAAASIAGIPFAMQWRVGVLPNGRRGLSIERVRWFFRRDARDVQEHEISALEVTGGWLILVLDSGERVSLTRLGESNIMTKWNQQRVVSGIQRVINIAAVKYV